MTTISRIHEAIDTLMATPAFQRALDFLEQDSARTVDELKAMAIIHGAPYKEHLQRSPMYKARLEACGAADCRIDEEGNVIGHVHGTGRRPQILIEAHLDTVFPEAPLAVTKKEGFLYCPGISDDTASLACLLSLVRAIRHAGLKPAGELVFGGTVGEEGEGNLRGIRVANIPSVPRGHSWYKFGTPNPFHAMRRGIAKIADIQVPQTPRTTFSAGLVSGGDLHQHHPPTDVDEDRHAFGGYGLPKPSG